MSSELNITYNAIPNKENIYYAFQRLISSLAISTIFEPYKESHEEFNEILKVVCNWAIDYDKNYDLTRISLDEVKNVSDMLFELDNKYLSKEGLYVEDAYEWILQIEILLEKSIIEKRI